MSETASAAKKHGLYLAAAILALAVAALPSSSSEAQTCASSDGASCTSSNGSGSSCSGSKCDAGTGPWECEAGETCCGVDSSGKQMECSYTSGGNTCLLAEGSVCTGNIECGSGSCVGLLRAIHHCAANVCSSSPCGSCASNLDCPSNYECYQNLNECVLVPGQTCTANDQCGSDSCSGGTCAQAGEGDFCVSNLDCTLTVGEGVCEHAGPDYGVGYGFCLATCHCGTDCG